MIDTTNLDIRPVITPDGIGTLSAFDNKCNPIMATVIFKGGKTRAYSIDKLDEVRGIETPSGSGSQRAG